MKDLSNSKLDNMQLLDRLISAYRLNIPDRGEIYGDVLDRMAGHPYTPDSQPTPKKGKAEITPLVIADLEKRKALGIERYGTPLQAHNGRDALVDAYEEALDLVMYLRQHMEEQKGHSDARA